MRKNTLIRRNVEMTSECRDLHIEGMYDNNRPLSARLMRLESGAPNENIVQNHINKALLNVF